MFYLRSGVVIDPSAATSTGEVPVFALNYDPDADAARNIHPSYAFDTWKVTNFADNRSRFVIQYRYLRVRCISVIIVAEPSAETDNSLGQFLLLQCPQCQVCFVYSLVAKVAVSGFPNPVPVIVQIFSAKRMQRRRSCPHIIIHRSRNRLRSVGFAYAVALSITQCMDVFDLAQIAGVDIIHQRDQADVRAVLRSGLDDAFVFSRRIDRDPPFEDIVRDGFFDIDILTRLACHYSHQRVPVVRRRDDDRIDILIVEYMSKIRKCSRQIIAFRVFLRQCLGYMFRVHVTYSCNTHSCNIFKPTQLVGPLPAETDYADSDIIVCPPDIRPCV